MWEYVDKKLKQFDKDYKKENKKTLDEIQNIFNGVKDLEQNASKTDLNRFKRNINNNYEYLSDYGKYQANKYLKKRKMKYKDMFWFNLFITYAYEQYRILKLEQKLFNEVANNIHNQEIKDLKKAFTIPKKKINIDNIINNVITSPNSKGYVWQDYNDAMTEYKVNEIYNQAIQNIRANKPLDINAKEFAKIISKQNNRLISVNGDKISGAIDNELIYLANKVKTETYIWCGVNKCKFIAVKDKVTTKMCNSLDGQIFNVHDWNEFYRYSASNETKVKYRVYGMIIGVNLPPIDDHYHACRSTITYQVNDERN